MDETDGISEPATIEAAPPMICFECGYPAPRARCPECGGALVPRSNLVDSRRNVHRLAILFAGVLIIDVLQILIVFVLPSVAPTMPTRMLQVFMNANQIASSGRLILLILAIGVILRSTWILSPGWRRWLGLLILPFVVWLGLDLLTIAIGLLPAGPIAAAVDVVRLLVWPATLVSVVGLYRAVGVCTFQDPGGPLRLWLRFGWICAAIILGVTGVVTITTQILIRIWNPTELLDGRLFDLLSEISRVALLAITAMSVGYLIGLLRWRGRLDRNLAAIDGAS